MIYVVLGVLGLCLGSFVNALVWRIREQEQRAKSRWNSSKKRKLSPQPSALSLDDLSILKGRSMCPHCKHALAARDLVPLFSWLSLGGKCRYCKKPIGLQYPVVELLTAVLFVASFIWWPMQFDASGSFNFAIWLVMLTGFMALLVYDLRWLLLPNRIMYPLIAVAALSVLVNITLFNGGVNLLKDTIFSAVIAGGLFYGLFELSKGRWIGGGDVKLGFLIGLLISSPMQAFMVLFLASLIGTLVILPGLAAKKLNTSSKVPFGPFLIAATILVRLFGAAIVTWYRRKFMLY